MLVQQNEFEYKFEFYKRSSNFRKKNEFNIPNSNTTCRYPFRHILHTFALYALSKPTALHEAIGENKISAICNCIIAAMALLLHCGRWHIWAPEHFLWFLWGPSMVFWFITFTGHWHGCMIGSPVARSCQRYLFTLSMAGWNCAHWLQLSLILLMSVSRLDWERFSAGI